MKIYYSASTRGFYTSSANASIPGDAIVTGQAAYEALMLAQADGYSIQPDAKGKPTAVAPVQPSLAQVQSILCASIDASADEAYIAIGGPSPGRMAEYQQANTDAAAFKAVCYTGSVPESIQCAATAAGISAKASADDNLATATQWTAVLNSVRSARLLGKAAVNAATIVDEAQACAATALASIRQAAGLV